MKRSGTLTTPITGLLVAVLLVGMGVTKAKAQSFFRQTESSYLPNKRD